jgi:hypothetical protein
MTWAWDTTGLEGEETLTFWIDPEDLIQEGDEDPANNVVTMTVQLLPADERPEVEQRAEWRSVTTDCCILHYLSGTSAERDLDGLITLSEEAVNYAEERLGAQLEEPFEVYFINRIIAHGGYARQHLVLAYLDRHYPGAHLELTIRHEATHVLDALALTSWSPSLLREGLAVWVTGGHFKPEPILPRASALLELDWYIPLEELATSFYPRQHEIGYLEGAAFVEYLVQTYGWDAFIEFYKRFDDIAYETPVDAIDSVLQESFGVSFEEAEQSFLNWLRANPPLPEHVRDVEDTVYFFDTVRHYQSVYDPTAWFMITWLPNPVVGEERSIEADFLRHPRSLENIALETMLIAAREAQLAESFDQAEALLDTVNHVVDTGIFEGTIAAEYLAIVEAADAAGYEVQQVDLSGTTARVWVIADWPDQVELDLQRTASEWVLSN